jgi:hypothetical protein
MDDDNNNDDGDAHTFTLGVVHERIKWRRKTQHQR